MSATFEATPGTGHSAYTFGGSRRELATLLGYVADHADVLEGLDDRTLGRLWATPVHASVEGSVVATDDVTALVVHVLSFSMGENHA